MKKSGLSLDKALKLQTTYTNKVAEIYGVAEVLHLTHEDVMERMLSGVYNQPDYQRLPAHAKAYVRGYAKARADEHYKYHLVWMHWLDGRLQTSDEVKRLTELEELHPAMKRHELSPWSRIDTDKSRHVWKNGKGQPVLYHPYDKRFLTYAPYTNSFAH